MRIKNALKNSLNSILCYLTTTLLLFFSRKLFLNSINIDSLGLDGVFKEVLTLVALADMGAEGTIIYRIYQAVARKQSDEVLKLMQLYKWIYCIIAVGIFTLGIIMIPMLPVLVTETDLNFEYICVAYILQLLGSISSYFLGYYRIRFHAEQKEYILIRADMCGTILGQILRVLILWVIPNYLLYIVVTIIQNVTANGIIAWRHRNEYGFIKRVRLSRKDFKDSNIFADMKNFVPNKLARTIYSGTDNIVISAILGIGQVALFTNYTLIVNQLNIVVNKLVTPILGGVADLVYSNELEKGKKLFYALDLTFFMMGCYLCGSVITIIQPFMMLWLGEEYIQSLFFAGLLVLNLYIIWAHRAVSIFRNTLGHFEEDKKGMIWSAVSNMFISVILAYKMGFSGVLLGTIIGHLIMWNARINVVFKIYIKDEKKIYIKKQGLRFLLAFGECCFVYILSCGLPVTWIGIVGRGIIVLIVINGINIVIFKKHREFNTIMNYMNEILKRGNEDNEKKEYL